MTAAPVNMDRIVVATDQLAVVTFLDSAGFVQHAVLLAVEA